MQKAKRPTAEEIEKTLDFACQWLGMDKKKINISDRKTRGSAEESLTCHIAQYLLSTVYEYNLAAIAEIFKKDRRTIGYAISKIEDLRDDSSFDKFLEDFKI